MALPVMKTPAEFIDYYFQLLRKDFNNVKLAKTGFMGFMLNLMGNIQFDIKNYYDNLFTESFPALAQDDKNLQLHADLHGYNIAFAKAATIVSGTLAFDLAYLPTVRNGLSSRTISFGGSSSSTTGSNSIQSDPLVIDSSSGISYTVDSVYSLRSKIVNGTIITYYAEVSSPTGQHNIAVQISNPKLPIISASQYVNLNTLSTVPFYPVGSYYNIDIPLNPSDMIFDIVATVTDSKTGLSSNYPVERNKNPFNSNSKVLFYTIQPGNIVRIECGSGVKGYRLQEASTVDVTIKITTGASGNINPPGNIGSISPEFATTATVTDVYNDGSIVTANIDLTNFIKPTIDNASGGVDVLTGVALQDALISYIQTRDNLISQTDYINTLTSIFKYYSVVFNKSKLSNNTINLQVPIFDTIGNIYQTSTVNYLESDFESVAFKYNNEVIVYNPQTTDSFGNSFVSPFYYRFDPLFSTHLGSILHQDMVINYNLVNNLSTTIEAPYIYLNVSYNHNTLSPYTILSINSYEDITPYISNGTISIEYVSQGIVSDTTQPFYLTPINQHSGILSTLTQNLNAGDLTMTLASTADFPLVGTVVVGRETIQYTGKDDATNTLVGLVRGFNSTADVATHDSYHAQLANVYDVTINNSKVDFIFGRIANQLQSNITSAVTTITLANEASQFPPSGTIIIGTEKITYVSKTGNTLNNCVRGAFGTASAAHTALDSVFELTTSVITNTEQALGCLITPTQLIITLNRSITDDIGVVTQHSHVYTFSIEQITDIRDYLFIKQYKQIGVIDSVNGVVDNLITTIPASSTAQFPASGLIRIDNEEMTYAGKAATTFTGCVRGSNGTIAVSHLAGTAIINLSVYELSIPVVDSAAYTTDTTHVLSEVSNAYSAINIPMNRSMGDEVQLKFLNTSSLTLPFLQQTVTNGQLYNSVNAPNGLLFPLKVSVSLLLNTLLITAAVADVASDIEQLKLTIAEALTTKYTDTQIRLSDADIILLAKAISYVDDANVTFTDSSTTPVNIANNEINVKSINSIIQTMSKADRISYNPVLWHWDINNIAITYTVE